MREEVGPAVPAHGHTRRPRHGTASYYAVPDQPKALHNPEGFQQPVTSHTPPCCVRHRLSTLLLFSPFFAMEMVQVVSCEWE